MTDPNHTGTALPDDAGNGMSDRAGYSGDSESGRTETPIGQGTLGGHPTGAVPTPSGNERGGNSTGTSFGPDGNDDGQL